MLAAICRPSIWGGAGYMQTQASWRQPIHECSKRDLFIIVGCRTIILRWARVVRDEKRSHQSTSSSKMCLHAQNVARALGMKERAVEEDLEPSANKFGRGLIRPFQFPGFQRFAHTHLASLHSVLVRYSRGCLIWISPKFFSHRAKCASVTATSQPCGYGARLNERTLRLATLTRCQRLPTSKWNALAVVQPHRCEPARLAVG